MTIKLLVADDHPVVRAGVKEIASATDIEVIGDATSGNKAVHLTAQLQPDVVLLDICIADEDGLKTLGRIRLDQPGLPIVMFSAYDNPTYIARTYALDAQGFLLKSESRKKILNSIRTVANGKTLWTREILRKTTGALAAPRIKSHVAVSLTLRESEVLRQLALGLTNKEIATPLHISHETVKEHVQHILHKLRVADRTQAAVWAVRHGVI